MTRITNEPTTTELAALLILSRLAHFFCGNTPYSTAYAAQCAVTTAIQFVLILPFLLRKSEWGVPHITKNVLRGFALLLAAKSTAETYQFLLIANAPRPALTLALLLLVVLYGLSLPTYTVWRSAILVLSASMIALFLLPLGGIFSAKTLSLWRVDLPPHLWQEWADSAETALLPLIIETAQKRGKRACAIWFGVRMLLLPLLILYGTMQCGRLQIIGNSPFLTLLARVPFSDTLRTDGFWWMLTVACCVLTIQYLLQFCCIHANDSARIRCTGIFALTAFSILFIIYPPHGLLFAIASVLLCIAAWIPKKGYAE